MYFNRPFIIRVTFFLCFCSCLSFYSAAQTREEVTVLNDVSGIPVAGVTIVNEKGQTMGRTDSAGKADVSIQAFPLFLLKDGYITMPVYDTQSLRRIRLTPMGQVLKTIDVTGKLNVKDYLLHLRDINYPHFVHHDTVIYYKFNYTLSFPDKNWQESASGYIKVRRLDDRTRSYGIDSIIHDRKYVEDELAANSPVFVQFHYKNTDNRFVSGKSFKKADPITFDFIFLNDFMRPQSYCRWEQLTHDYTFFQRIAPFSVAKILGDRYWRYKEDPDGTKVFSSVKGKDGNQLMEEITFDSTSNLSSVTLFTPDVLNSYSGVKLMDNFSLGTDEMNTFKTTYYYSNAISDRLLTGIDHTSTYYKKGVTFYRMTFSATLYHAVPEQQCSIPVSGMLATDYNSNRHGYGVWQAIAIEKDEKD